MTDQQASAPLPSGSAQKYAMDQGDQYPPPQQPYGGPPPAELTGYGGGGQYPPQSPQSPQGAPAMQPIGYGNGQYPPQALPYDGAPQQQAGYGAPPMYNQGPAMPQSGYGGGQYPPPATYAPPYTGGEQSSAQQMQSTNVVVVQSQPQVVTHAVKQPVGITDSNNGFILALIATVFIVIFGCWWGLICSIPAMIIAYQSLEAARRGDSEAVRKSRNISLGLSVTAIVSSVGGFIVLVAVAVYA